MKNLNATKDKIIEGLIGHQVLVQGKYNTEIICTVVKAEEDILYAKDEAGNKLEFSLDEIIMRVFETVEAAKEYGYNNGFSKYQSERVLIDGKKTLLCGTCLVYEDNLWGGMYETLKVMLETCQIEEDDCDGIITDKASVLRDNVIEWIEKEYDVQIVTVYDEY